MSTKLTSEIITAAIVGFESQKQYIETRLAELRSLLKGGTVQTASVTGEAPVRKRKISAAARRRMAIGQKARWAKAKGESQPSSAAKPKAAQPKRRLSAAGRAAIIAATKKRWALKRAADAKAAAQKKSPAKATKKAAPAKKAAAPKPEPAAAEA